MKKLALLFVLAALAALPLAACEKPVPPAPPRYEAAVPPENEEYPGNEEGPEKEEVPEDEEDPEKEEVPEDEEDPVPGKTPARTEYVRVLADGLRVRAGAGTEFPVLGAAEKGVLLPRGEKSGSWYTTSYRGKTAFVSADGRYTEPFFLGRADERTERVIAEGCRLLGVPYVYGAVRFHDGTGLPLKGFSEERFDCSSLMQYLFFRGADVLLGVTTRVQVKQGHGVEKSELVRGDLLFFTNAAREHNAGIERVGHVGLYLGDNYILHTASDYAKIEPISAKRWGYFLGGRRVL